MRGRMGLRAAMVAASLTLGGCLISESDEYHLTLDEGGKICTLTQVSRNLQSDALRPADQREDFDQLIRNWKGDEYLLDNVKKGIYLRDRNLTLEQGVLVWRETQLFPADSLPALFGTGDTMRFPVGDAVVVSTNGTVVKQADSAVVVWPPRTRDFQLLLRYPKFAPKSDFATRFKEWTSRH